MTGPSGPARIPHPAAARGPFRQLSAAARAASLAAARAAGPGSEDFWVFGYASLMWNPCFDHLEQREATLEGYARRFCVWTALARGTPARPGLALGLEAAEASCRGIAFRLRPSSLGAGLSTLWEREMVTGIYKPCWVSLSAAAGPISGLAFVVDPTHEQYAGTLPIEKTAAVIAAASGKFGSCSGYLEQTVAALSEAGCPDPELTELHSAVRLLA